jgi:hypothetical protein
MKASRGSPKKPDSWWTLGSDEYTELVRVFTDLDLNSTTPIRVQPGLGEWGPSEIMPTKRKKLTRWLWSGAFVSMVGALFGFGYYVYGLIMNSGM